MFLSDSPRLLATLHQSLATQATDELHRAAHMLKSSSATLGASALAKLSQQIEQLSRGAAFDQIEEHVRRLDALYTQSSVALQAARARYARP